VDGQHYLEICNWLSHQKIDHPSPSKFPAPPNARESSRILASETEKFALDQGSRIKDQGSRIKDQGGDQGQEERRARENDDQPSPPEITEQVATPKPVSPPSPAPPPIPYRSDQYRTSMIDAIRKLFETYNPQGFTDPRREFSASVELADKFLRMGRDDPVHFGSVVIETYRGMIADGRDKFWRHQPLTALNLNKSGIFDQVIAEIRAQEGAAGSDFEEAAAAEAREGPAGSGFDEFAAAEAHG